MAEKIELIKPDSVPTYSSVIEDKINEIIELVNPMATYLEALIKPKEAAIKKMLKDKDAGDMAPSPWQLMDKINELVDAVNLSENDILVVNPELNLGIRYEELKEVMEKVKPQFESGGERGLTTFDVTTSMTRDHESKVYTVLIY